MCNDIIQINLGFIMLGLLLHDFVTIDLLLQELLPFSKIEYPEFFLQPFEIFN